MGSKRKRDKEEADYDLFCQGLGETCSTGLENNSFVYSSDRRKKRLKINPNFYPVKSGAAQDVSYRELHWSDDQFRKIENLIHNPTIIIDSIIKVDNPLLMNAYYRKKEEKLKEFNGVEEHLLFHGTKDNNVESICKYNFDWRLYGKNVGHKFGKGVNFSINAKYASAYTDPNSYVKVMIIAKVLIANVCQGKHDMSIPPPGFDTTQKGQNGIVMVKYEDNEFYPAYILYFHFRDRNTGFYGRYNNLNRHRSCDNLYRQYDHNDHYYDNDYHNAYRYKNNRYYDDYYCDYRSDNYNYYNKYNFRK